MNLFNEPIDPAIIRTIENKLLRKTRGESGKRLLTDDEKRMYADWFREKGQKLAAEFWANDKRE